MSTLIMSQCWPLQGMSATQKAVLISLADNANDEGVCWPSIATISMRTCLSERAVQNAIKWLVEHRILSVQSRSGRSTVYKVTPAEYAPPQEVHPRTRCTPPPQEVHPTPAPDAPHPRTTCTQNRKEPSKEPQGNRKSARTKKTADRFEEFWQAYPNTPRRVAKKKCRERWRSRKLDQIADQIIGHVLAMKKTQQWLDGFEPGPMTYINQSRWEDGVPEERATNQRAYGQQERFDPVEYINRNRISKQQPKMEELDVIDC